MSDDKELCEAYVNSILALFPGMPEQEARAIKNHAKRQKWDLSNPHPGQVEGAVKAHVRHKFTDYDLILANGESQERAEREANRDIERIMAIWQGKGGKPYMPKSRRQ